MTPERVMELSQGEIEALRERVSNLEENLDTLRRATEATRRKVYRDLDGEANGGAIAGVAELKPPVSEAPVKTYRTGDPVTE